MEDFLTFGHRNNCFILGTCEVENKTYRIQYTPCNCKEKYQFKESSKLLPYLQQCKGWVNDDEGYSLNYILIVLIAYLCKKNLITTHTLLRKHVVEPDIELKQILVGLDSSLTYYDILEIKISIAKYHLKKFEQRIRTSTPYFVCPQGSEAFILSILGPEGSDEKYFGYH